MFSILRYNVVGSILYLYVISELCIQVRIEGVIEKVTLEESQTYWNRRPRRSQISAAVSGQSSVTEFSGKVYRGGVRFPDPYLLFLPVNPVSVD